MRYRDIVDVETHADIASLDQAEVRLCHGGSASLRALRYIFGLASADQSRTPYLALG